MIQSPPFDQAISPKDISVKLCVIAFFSGAVVMTMEIIGSRVLAPFVGASVFVWTGLIGVMLASLSLGYWRGGMIADKDPTLKRLSRILFIASICTLLSVCIRPVVFVALRYLSFDFRLQSVIAAFLLFFLPSIYLGMVLPFVTRLALDEKSKAGSLIGRIYAVSTAGSIIGTFATGFVFIAFFGITTILIILAVILLLLSWYTNGGAIIKKLNIFGMAGLIFLAVPRMDGFLGTVIARSQSQYQYIRVIESDLNQPGQRFRLLMTDDMPYRNHLHFYQALMDCNHPDQLQSVLQYYRLVEYFQPRLNKVLVVGGGGYAYPRFLMKQYQDILVDVVEIDPQITAFARKYFYLSDTKRMRIFHEDGRMYLNRSQERYDAIILDAYTSGLPPFQLLTREAAIELYRLLTVDGVLLVNVFSAVEGERGESLKAIYATFRSVFPYAEAFITGDVDKSIQQTVLVIAFKSPRIHGLTAADPVFQSLLAHSIDVSRLPKAQILTDEYAPVEFIHSY